MLLHPLTLHRTAHTTTILWALHLALKLAPTALRNSNFIFVKKYIEINVLDHHPRSSNQQTAQGIFLYRVQQSPTLTVIDFCQATIGKLIR